MKKLFVLLLALVMSLSLAACGGGEDTVDTGDAGGAAGSSDAGGAAGSAAAADNTDAEINDEQLAALIEAYNQVAPLYNEATVNAEANGWLADEMTATEIQTLNAMLGTIGQALTEDLTMLDGSDFDALPDTLLELVDPLNELIERVSVPYEG